MLGERKTSKPQRGQRKIAQSSKPSSSEVMRQIWGLKPRRRRLTKVGKHELNIVFHSVKMQPGFSKLTQILKKGNSYLTKAKGHWKDEDKLRRIAQVSVDGKVSGLTRSPEELAPTVRVSSLPSLRTADA